MAAAMTAASMATTGLISAKQALDFLVVASAARAALTVVASAAALVAASAFCGTQSG